MAVDWAAALDYVTHHELTYRDFAEKYHAYPSTIWKRVWRSEVPVPLQLWSAVAQAVADASG